MASTYLDFAGAHVSLIVTLRYILWANIPILGRATDYFTLSNLTCDYFHSLDSKDWNLLRTLVAPTLRTDYTELGGPIDEAVPADDFVARASSVMFGDPLLRTHHLLGASKWSVDEKMHVTGRHQVRSESRILASEGSKEVSTESHRWVVVTVSYAKVDGAWKVSGIAPKSL
ncbi:scytalone dehydratase [Dactylonectria macrodidyma]|uniref:Scytalone dehydratase n=1 Tax=Dactylonectria macrodidyma TaxID=307937 RepID=A0A9P9ES95_9HYPO|nr:scytalone dehydratase [Dactylonectria macrodidyma]